MKQRFGHYPPGSIIGVTINLFRVWPDTNRLCLQTSSSKPQAEAPPPLPHSSQLMLTWALSPVFFLTSCSQDLGRNHPSPVGSRLSDSCGPARKASLMALRRGGIQALCLETRVPAHLDRMPHGETWALVPLWVTQEPARQLHTWAFWLPSPASFHGPRYLVIQAASGPASIFNR